MRKTLTNACVGLAVLGLAAGCSSSDNSSKKDDSKAAATTTAVAGTDNSAGGSGSAGTPPVTGVIERYEGVQGEGIADSVTTDHCDTKTGPATAAGTVQLPEGKKTSDVIINVGWVNAQTGTVIAKRMVEVKGVKADAASQWSTDVELPDNPDVTIRCNVGAFIKG